MQDTNSNVVRRTLRRRASLTLRLQRLCIYILHTWLPSLLMLIKLAQTLTLKKINFFSVVRWLIAVLLVLSLNLLRCFKSSLFSSFLSLFLHNHDVLHKQCYSNKLNKQRFNKCEHITIIKILDSTSKRTPHQMHRHNLY